MCLNARGGGGGNLNPFQKKKKKKVKMLKRHGKRATPQLFPRLWGKEAALHHHLFGSLSSQLHLFNGTLTRQSLHGWLLSGCGSEALHGKGSLVICWGMNRSEREATPSCFIPKSPEFLLDMDRKQMEYKTDDPRWHAIPSHVPQRSFKALMWLCDFCLSIRTTRWQEPWSLTEDLLSGGHSRWWGWR